MDRGRGNGRGRRGGRGTGRGGNIRGGRRGGGGYGGCRGGSGIIDNAQQMGSPNPERRRRRPTRVYQDYMDKLDVDEGLQAGTLFRGKLRINARSRSTAFVTADGAVLPSDIFLENEKARNRAKEGDVVAIKLAPVTEWRPIKQSSTRSSGSATVADMLGSVSIVDNSETCNERVQPGSCDKPSNTLRDFIGSRAWEDTATSSEMRELWRPLPTVVRGALKGQPQGSTLCEQGILAAQGNLQPMGQVVFILEKNQQQEDQMGSLVLSSPLKADGKLCDSDSYVMFHPVDRRAPYMLITRGDLPSLFVDNPGAFGNSIFMACAKSSWAATSKLPWGHNVRFVGEAGAIHAETKALLMQHKVDHGDFPHTVMRDLQAFLPKENDEVDSGASVRGSRWKIPEEEIAARRDLRDERIFTIDPTGARDLDDALSVTPLADGTVQIGVHIADVTYFVRPNSELDKEALRRATTVYLVQQAIPMLPPLFCEELCSLNPRVDRLTYSCIWRMNKDGTLVDEQAWFGRTVIRSCCKLDYQTAQHMIEGSIQPRNASSSTPDLWDPFRRPKEHSCEEVCKDVLLMHTLARARRAKRFESGALSLNTPKLTFVLDENGNPTEFGFYSGKDSNDLVEEYMLLANFLVAQQILVAAGDQALLRVHPPPSNTGMAKLKETLAGCGIELDITSSGSLQASLLRIRATTDETMAQVCTMMSTIPMRDAGYVAAGREASWRHYGLNIPVYTHFTSPIRRYADVMVHRILTATLDGNDAIKNTYDVRTVSVIAEHCTDKHRAAKQAQERSDEMYLSVYLQSHPSVEEEAVVTSMSPKSFRVHVPRLGITKSILYDKIPDIVATFNKVENTLNLQATSTVTHQWTTSTVRILSRVVVRCLATTNSGAIEPTIEFLRPKC